ncbi:MAG: hypothetical protein ACI92I_000053 [Acidimicrobiales bacterium]|jgi:hypothetical protein
MNTEKKVKKEASENIKNLYKVPFFQRIVIRITLFLLTVGTASFLLMNYFFIEYAEDVFRKDMGENAVVVVQQAMDKIQSDINKRVEYIHAYTRDTTLQSVLRHSNENFAKIDDVARTIQERDAQWIATSAGTTTELMNSLLQNELSHELRELSGFFVEEYEYPVYSEIFVTNVYGANIAQTGRTTDYYQADEAWWQHAVAEGIYVGPVVYDESAEVFSMDIAVSIADESGEMAGVIIAVLNIAEIIDTIKIFTTLNNGDEEESAIHVSHGHESHRSMYFTLAETDNTLIYSNSQNNPNDLLARNEHNHGIENDIGDYHFVTLATGNEVLLAHSTGYAYSKQKDSDIYLPWVLTMEHEVLEVREDSDDAFDRFVILATLIFGFIFSCIILFLLISVTHPITVLTNAANMTAVGDFTKTIKVKVKGRGEIARLIEVYNMTMRTLTESQEHLEENVQERTKALQDAQLDLESKLLELEKFQSVTVNRELKMIALKKEIEELKAKFGDYTS